MERELDDIRRSLGHLIEAVAILADTVVATSRGADPEEWVTKARGELEEAKRGGA